MIGQSNDSEERGQMQNLIKIVIFSLALGLLAGCSYFGVYKRDLPQGNLITQEMLAQLKPGMTRKQVQYVMGSPLLETPFSASQWDYVFLLDKAYGGKVYKRLTLTFADDRLVDMRTSGDIDKEVELKAESSAGPAIEEDALPGNLLDTTPNRVPQGGEPATGAVEGATPAAE
ncbi:MAG: small protein A [Halomonadaceae bacterium T82-2]|nr:MAG: small protein A [Halomonadaceae bacterium T82-2]